MEIIETMEIIEILELIQSSVFIILGAGVLILILTALFDLENLVEIILEIILFILRQFKMLFFKIKIMCKVPIKNEFYIEFCYDPFSADIVKINDVYDNMIDFNILKFKYYGNKGKQFEKSTDFFENYK